MVKKIYRTYRRLTIEEEKEKFGFSETEEMMKGMSPLMSMSDPGMFLKRVDTIVEDGEEITKGV